MSIHQTVVWMPSRRFRASVTLLAALVCEAHEECHVRQCRRQIRRCWRIARGMSAFGTKQTSISTLNMSAFGGKADIPDPLSNVR